MVTVKVTYFGKKKTHEMMIPLSTEKLSEGRPAMVQLRIFTGSPKEFISDMFLEQGIPLVLHVSIHSSVARCRDQTQKHTHGSRKTTWSQLL